MNSPLPKKTRAAILPSLASIFKNSLEKSVLSAEDFHTDSNHPHSSRVSLKTEEKLDGLSEPVKVLEHCASQESLKVKKTKNVVFQEEREYLTTPLKKAREKAANENADKRVKKGILVRRRLYSDYAPSGNKDSTAENSQSTILPTEEKVKENNETAEVKETKEVQDSRELNESKEVSYIKENREAKVINQEGKRVPTPIRVVHRAEIPDIMSSFVGVFERQRSDSVDKVRTEMPSTPDILDRATLRGSGMFTKNNPSIFRPSKNDAISLFKGSPKSEDSSFQGQSLLESKNQPLRASLFGTKESKVPAFNIGSEQSLAKLLHVQPSISNESKSAKEILAQLRAERLEYDKIQPLENPFESFGKHKKSNSVSESTRSNFALAASSMLKPEPFKLPNIPQFSQKTAVISSFQAASPNPLFLGTPKKL